jgi:hypothetical protein
MKKPVTKAAYERSRYDNDKGVKEGSKADKARDKKGMEAMKKAKGKSC